LKCVHFFAERHSLSITGIEMTSLPRVRSGLLKHNVDDQELIYDPRADRVHLLDPTTACVLALLQEGGWTPEGIVIELSGRLGIVPNPSLVPLAIEELRAADLLEPAAGSIDPLVDVTRRELIKKVGLVGAAALLIPSIVTFTATPGYAQASGAGTLAAGSPCSATPGQQCAPGLYCYPSNPGVCVPQGCTVGGGSCSSSSTCCSDYKTGNQCNGSPKTCDP
jgi:hypothetical protein